MSGPRRSRLMTVAGWTHPPGLALAFLLPLASSSQGQIEGPYAGAVGAHVLTTDASPTVRELAEVWAPSLWFSDYEPLLLQSGELADMRIPERLPMDMSSGTPATVYYRPRVITETGGPGLLSSWDLATGDASPAVHDPLTGELFLDQIDLIRLEYLFYFRQDWGGGGHAHDLEIAEFWLRVTKVVPGIYTIRLQRIIGYAHGHKGFANKLDMSSSTSLDPMTLPVTLLIEQGKHAPSPDRIADGDFTPGFDVNEMVADAWGIRDAFSSSWLGTRAYSSWMTLRRTKGRVAYHESWSMPPPPASATESWPYELRDFRQRATTGDPPEDLRIYLEYHEYQAHPQDGPDRFLGLLNYFGAGGRFDVDAGAAAYLSLMLGELPMIGGHPVITGFMGGTWTGHNLWYGASAFYTPAVAGFFSLYGGVTWTECGSCAQGTQIGPEAGFKLRIPVPHPPAPDFVGLRVGLRYPGFSPIGSPRLIFELGFSTP